MINKFNHWIPRLIAKIKRTKTMAVTISSTCTLYSESEEYVMQAVNWRKHEDCHKQQIKSEGWFVFMVKYAWYQIRYGYTNNPYEILARGAETK